MSVQPSLQSIASASAVETGVSPLAVIGQSQETVPSLARERAFYLARQLRPELSLTSIGRPFGRDHSTVHRGVRRVAQRIMAGDAYELDALTRIRARLESGGNTGDPLALIAQMDEALDAAAAALERARALRDQMAQVWS